MFGDAGQPDAGQRGPVGCASKNEQRQRQYCVQQFELTEALSDCNIFVVYLCGIVRLFTFEWKRAPFYCSFAFSA